MSLWLYGEREKFALGFEFFPDPDPDGEPARRASWAKLQIWAGGRNLTAGITAGRDYVTEAECPILPVIEWLITQWDPLLHEERFPTQLPATSSAAWHMAILGELPTDPDATDRIMEERQRWREHHGLGSALPDFRIPDLHFRRFGEDIELSWDDREWRSVPTGVRLVESRGAVYVSVSAVVDVLVKWCDAALSELAASNVPEAAARAHALQRDLRQLSLPERQESRLQLAAGLQLERAAKRLHAMAGVTGNSLDDIKGTIRTLLGMTGERSSSYFAVLPPPVLLYRSAAPSLSDSDLQALLELGTAQVGGSAKELQRFRIPTLCPHDPQETTQQGYALALEFRGACSVPETAPLSGDYDLETDILPRLGVLLRELRLSDTGVEGAAMLRPGVAPIVAVNLSGKFAKTRPGRRMTLAHELCHLLHDGESTVGIVSNPWAPDLIERRASAFAAMLLAPEAAIAQVLDKRPEQWDRHDLRRAMDFLGVGLTTLTRQLCNLRWITEQERKAWVEEMVDA